MFGFKHDFSTKPVTALSVKCFTCLMNVYFYRPQRSCGQGYVFTRVCDSVNRGVSGEPPPGPRRTPRTRQTPPQHQADPPPGTRQTPPSTRQTPPPRWLRTLQHTVNERPVRILLECILVEIKINKFYIV